jgi:thioredoxin 1
LKKGLLSEKETFMHTTTIHEADFATLVLQANVPVLVDFGADWCPPCKMIDPIVEEIAVEYAGKLQVTKMDADASQAIVQQYQVLGMPTLILFKNGQEVERIVGFKPKSKIVSKLQAHL